MELIRGSVAFRTFAVATLLFAANVLAGCATLSGYPRDPQNPSDLETLRTKYFSSGIEDCYKQSGCLTGTGYAYASKQAMRDDIVLNRIHVYDMEFTLFIRELSGANNEFSVGTDLTALALSGLGATTGNAATKAALAAASGGVIASDGAVNKDLFYQKTVPAIVSQMQADRTKVETTILEGLKQTDTVYPLQRAELDLDTLNDAGSLNSAISNITQQSSAQKSDSQTIQSLIQSSPLSQTSTSTLIRNWLFSGGTSTINQANFAKLVAWMAAYSDPNISALAATQDVEAFADISNSTFETARKKAISDLGIS